MKVKHTQNGNVKITLTLEEAERLKSIVMEADELHTRMYISAVTRELGDDLCEALGDAGIAYKL
jgi:hypothetical protein